MARPLASQMTFLTLNGLVGASAEVVRGQNIARIAKAALHKLPGKSSLNVRYVCPVSPLVYLVLVVLMTMTTMTTTMMMTMSTIMFMETMKTVSTI